MPAPKPESVDIITYEVGFGDCFLLRIHYPGQTRSRSVLIDFGSTQKNNFSLGQVSQKIKSDCGGKLDVVVATHRHKDHVHGFTLSSKNRGTGKVIRDLQPGAVIMPWTEDPDADPKARQPTKRYSAHEKSLVKRLGNMQALAGALAEQSKMFTFAGEKGIRTQLKALGENNLGNASAMKNLRTMSPRTYYAYHNMKLRLSRELPGVKVHVLGPPTLKQSAAIEKQRSRDQDEFWHLQASAAHEALDPLQLFPNAREIKNPVWGRWTRRRLRKARGEELLSIVRSLDHAMNNTSLILLFEIGNKKLLFPGDAQYENWMYCLEKKWVKDLLRGVDVYKVGHHGSLNATPKTMLGLFQKTRSQHPGEVMHSLLSTKAGVHGSVDNQTEVPRGKLVNKLTQETQLTSTQNFDGEISRMISLEV
ncbi:MAG: hypothetical protein KC553_14130 [Nitrospina sp.]|nr:hypothetical protein [Nitrospina sp.]